MMWLWPCCEDKAQEGKECFRISIEMQYFFNTETEGCYLKASPLGFYFYLFIFPKEGHIKAWLTPEYQEINNPLCEEYYREYSCPQKQIFGGRFENPSISLLVRGNQ